MNEARRGIGSVFGRSLAIWSDARAGTLGAALAYFMVFSLGPLLLLILGVAGLVLGPDAAKGQLAGELESTLGEQTARAVQEILKNAEASGSARLSLGIGAILLMFGASGVFAELQRALNAIWGVRPKPGITLFATLRARYLSITMVMGTCFFILTGLVLTSAIGDGRWLGEWFGVDGEAVSWLRIIVARSVSLGVVIMVFTLIYHYLPDAEIAWRDAIASAIVTTILYMLGRELLALYFRISGVTNAYGAAGSLVLILLWVYYSAQIFLFGAAFGRAWAERSGRGVQPEPHAILNVAPTGPRSG